MPLYADEEETHFPDQCFTPGYLDLLFTPSPPPIAGNNIQPSPSPILHAYVRPVTPPASDTSNTQISPPKLATGSRKYNRQKMTYIYPHTNKSVTSYYPMLVIDNNTIHLGSCSSINIAKTVQYLCCKLLEIAFPTATIRPTALFEQQYSARQLEGAKQILTKSKRLLNVTGVKLKASDFDSFAASSDAAAFSAPKKKLRT